ncbi:hypothetical protein PFISCL1PPCAC_22522, partial [Pristionchus fissidentatus]
ASRSTQIVPQGARDMVPLSALALLSALFASALARVTFPSAELLDTVDLKQKITASFKCAKGCRVYSPTKNANIVIVDGAGVEGKSLFDLANSATPVELPAGANYMLKNKGLGDPKFVFYAVEKGAANYNTKVTYVDAAGSHQVTVSTDTMLSVLSDSGIIRVFNFAGDYSRDLPSVYATGFDSIAACRPVYTASSARTVVNTLVPVAGPIATINMKSNFGKKSFTVSGSSMFSQDLSVDASAVFVSPGYVGCQSTGDSLYTLVTPLLNSIDQMFSRTDTNGLKLQVSADYKIANQADALQVSVNDKTEKLYGKNTYSKSYDGTSFKVKVAWTRKDGSTDRFAMQVDMWQKGGNAAPGVSTSTQAGSSLSFFLSTALAGIFYMVR